MQFSNAHHSVIPTLADICSTHATKPIFDKEKNTVGYFTVFEVGKCQY